MALGSEQCLTPYSLPNRSFGTQGSPKKHLAKITNLVASGTVPQTKHTNLAIRSAAAVQWDLYHDLRNMDDESNEGHVVPIGHRQQVTRRNSV